ncbi:SCP2 sterol-binding domain-containing protein [Rhodanobacter sp. 115]|uniref:ubiquinone anaerobic biosynthesis accessory factor UbiT n=1 Tax=Rhodanobacter sp. FW021-MT20 TaxID=1162282 RepID=UPI000260DB93|nr:SCP2 sterol-binding domain-containing protein [Rhodanobacter sp. 115]EIL86846.1 hypothetical protein UU5_20590 [Rhodanobacter sp. 115]
MSSVSARFMLAQLRLAIDHVDDGLIVLLAARRRLVQGVAAVKPRAGVPSRDPMREGRVRARAQALAWRLNLPQRTATGVLDLAIGDACRLQGVMVDPDQDATAAMHAIMPSAMTNTLTDTLPTKSLARRLLRLLPPPRAVAPLLRMLPARAQHALLERAMARVLDVPLQDGTLDFMRGRRLAIEVSDLQLRWVLELEGDRLRVIDAEPEASVRGSATDLLLLAGRLEDADTLFFQRALNLTGDTELGLTARNLLERLPWESVPLALRIVLNRGARFARAARSAHRGESA